MLTTCGIYNCKSLFCQLDCSALKSPEFLLFPFFGEAFYFFSNYFELLSAFSYLLSFSFVSLPPLWRSLSKSFLCNFILPHWHFLSLFDAWSLVERYFTLFHKCSSNIFHLHSVYISRIYFTSLQIPFPNSVH